MTTSQHISSAIIQAEGILRAHARAQGDQYETVYHLTPESLHRFEAGIPVEYQSATMPPKLRAIIAEEPVSIALLGPPGTGKTYLCWGVLRDDRQRQVRQLLDEGEVPKRDEKPIQWLHRMVERIVSSDRVKIISESAHIRYHRHDRDWLENVSRWRGLLCIDDIGFTGKADDWVVESIYHLANERRALGRKTMYTSNLSADEMRSVFGAAVASRILGGAIVPVSGTDRRLA
jgi:hypothetical protein